MDGSEVSLKVLEIVLGRHLSGAGIVHHLPQGHPGIASCPCERELSIPVQSDVVFQLPLLNRLREQLAHNG